MLVKRLGLSIKSALILLEKLLDIIIIKNIVMLRCCKRFSIIQLYRAEQEKRRLIKQIYDENLSKVKGIKIPQMPANTTNSYQYYPIVVEKDFPITRDDLYEKFKSINILTRKYFYPACHDYECYKNDITVKTARLRVTDDLKHRVLCLPYYGDLEHEVANLICEVIQNVAK